VEDMHEAVDRQKGDIQQEGNLELVGLEDSHKAAHMFVEVHSRHVEELADQYVTSAALEVQPQQAVAQTYHLSCPFQSYSGSALLTRNVQNIMIVK
jgi:hypothetical protein